MIIKPVFYYLDYRYRVVVSKMKQYYTVLLLHN